jgi:hypothetical protein
MKLRTFVLTGLLCAAPHRPAFAQNAPPSPPTRPDEALKILLDCKDFYCDLDFFRIEITFVNFVRDRADAEVHILGTAQSTNGGGRQYTLDFTGLRAFAGRNDQLRYLSQANEPEDATRQGLARIIKVGLVRYVADTAFADQLQISAQPATQAVRTPSGSLIDPWNLWVFRTRVNGSVNGERSSKSSNISAGFSENRTTEAWKINLEMTGNYSARSFLLSDETTFNTISRNLGVNFLVVKSLNDHWSAVANSSVSSSTFLSQALAVRAGPGIEYDLFPYAESTRRQLTFQYVAGISGFRYDSETIFDKLSETLFDETLLVSLDIKQRWGSAGLSFEAAHYFHDLHKNHLVLFGETDIKLFKGFSVTLNGSASRIHDQLYLRKGEATPEEILVRQRQLLTSYRYFLSVGIRYTFGSIYNNVVNPRFNGSGGSF